MPMNVMSVMGSSTDPCVALNGFMKNKNQKVVLSPRVLILVINIKSILFAAVIKKMLLERE